MKITKWNADKILKKPAKILEEYGPVIAEETHRQMATVKYDWNYDTLRFESLLMLGEPIGNGVFIPEGLRDIVDTGRLMDSITQPVVQSTNINSVLTIQWTAPYAAKVLYGGVYGTYTNPAGEEVDIGYRPGRDWITPAFAQKPFEPFFGQRWRAKA